MSASASPRLLDASAPDDDSGLLLYEPYYGLSEKPFSLSTDPRFLYKSASHTPVFQDVLAGIRRREGLVVLTGEIGMGKTTLCRSVLGALDRKTFSAFVPDPFVTREDLLKILLVEFGVVSVDDLVRGRLQGASRAELSYPLYEFLRSLEPLDAFAVLLLDEAQNLPVPLLEEIRILSDLEGTRRLLQVVLIGQPELSAALRLPHMRQMRQRVTTHCELQPLGREGVYGYVGHRLTVAGATGDRLRFTGEALDLVFEASGGVPRVINRLCDRTLQHGQQARSATIGHELVRAAVEDLQLTVPAAEDAAAPGPAAAPSLPLAAVLASAVAADTIVPMEPAAAPAAVRPAAEAASPAAPAGAAGTCAELPAALMPFPLESEPGPDDLRALLSLPPTTPADMAAPVAQPRTDRVRIGREARTARASAHRGASIRPHARGRRGRPHRAWGDVRDDARVVLGVGGSAAHRAGTRPAGEATVAAYCRAAAGSAAAGDRSPRRDPGARGAHRRCDRRRADRAVDHRAVRPGHAATRRSVRVGGAGGGVR